MPSERSPKRVSSKVRDKDGDQNGRHRLPDAVSLEASDSKKGAKHASEKSDRKGDAPAETTDPTVLPRPRSYIQHDGRGSTAEDGRRAGRRTSPDRGKWRDSRDEDRATRRTATSNPTEKEKPEARGGDSHVSRHDRLSKVDKNTDPPAKKRRQFREEKLPPESEPVVNAAPESGKNSHALNITKDIDRQGDRDRDRRPLERSDYGRTYGRARSFSFNDRAGRTDFPPRDRSNGGDYDRFRGRNNFGGRQGYQTSGGREEKWKHDLYDQTNETPTKNEEDPVAKVEALLSM